MRFGRLLLLAAALLLTHGQPQHCPAQDSVPSLTVFAAASLTDAFRRIAAAFEQTHSGAKVQLNFGGSAGLARQIQQGAPADVFAAADEANMQKLIDTQDIAGESQIFAGNRLSIAVTSGNPHHIAELADLTKPGLALALCAPAVPCGRYAAELFGKAGLPVPAASQELDVKAVLNKVALGEADAGIVYATDLSAAAGRVEGVAIPAALNVIARYPIAVVRTAANADLAAAFVRFVLSTEGQQHLAAAGFQPR